MRPILAAALAALAFVPPAAAQDQPKEKPWYERMDFGPTLAQTFTSASRESNTVLKGIAVKLGDANHPAGLLFDTELLRVACVWPGRFLALKGTPFDGSHGPHSKTGAPAWFDTDAVPGWSLDGSFADPRPLPGHGTLPRALGRYRGMHLTATGVAFEYDAGGARVLEVPSMQALAGDQVFVRAFELQPAKVARTVLLADGLPGEGFAVESRSILIERDAKGTGPGGSRRESLMFVLSEGAPAGAEFALQDGRALLRLPPHAAAARFDVRVWSGDRAGLDPVYAAARAAKAEGDLRKTLTGGPTRWTETITVAGQLGADDSAYTVDTIPVPFGNPYASWMRIGAFDFFPDGETAAVSTWNGDVWVVSGLDADLDKVTWKRFATGLFDPLGLKIVGGVVHTLGRDGITRLHDRNGDGEADWYECFNNDVLITQGFHEFAFDLHTDPQGNFYFAKAGPVNPGGRGFQKIVPHHGCILRVSPDGEKIDVYATGFRAPNGIGVGPQGHVTSGDNEGTWMPKCRLNWVKPGSFNGCVDLAHRDVPPSDYDKPLCWLPHDIDNSGGSQVWVTSDRWGPLQGELLHLSYGTCSVFKVLKEEVGGQIQGGVVRLPLSFASSCMRARFNAKDGQLWVSGLKGWQTSAAQDGGFQRVRYTGKPVYLPMELRTLADGVAITFSVPLDKEVAEDPQSWDVAVWNYIWGQQYGSPHISVADPAADMQKMGGKIDIGYRNSDKLAVSAAKLDADGRTVRLTIPGIQPVMQMQIRCNVDAADGQQIKQTIWNTIHTLGK